MVKVLSMVACFFCCFQQKTLNITSWNLQEVVLPWMGFFVMMFGGMMDAKLI